MMKEEEGNLERKCEQEELVTYYLISVPSACIHVTYVTAQNSSFNNVSYNILSPKKEKENESPLFANFHLPQLH